MPDLAESKPKHYFESTEPVEFEPYIDYECLLCGIIEGEEDDDGDAGIVIPSKYSEIYLCGKCRKLFSK